MIIKLSSDDERFETEDCVTTCLQTVYYPYSDESLLATTHLYLRQYEDYVRLAVDPLLDELRRLHEELTAGVGFHRKRSRRYILLPGEGHEGKITLGNMEIPTLRIQTEWHADGTPRDGGRHFPIEKIPLLRWATACWTQLRRKDLILVSRRLVGSHIENLD